MGLILHYTWWKYQYNVAHSIIAICLVGDVAGLKSTLLGFEMEDMKRLSRCSVGLLKRWMWLLFRGRYGSSSFSELESGSSSSSDSIIIVHPGGKTERWIVRSFALKDKPANTGDTVTVWPLGKCTTVGAMVRRIEAATARCYKVLVAQAHFIFNLAGPITGIKVLRASTNPKSLL